MATPIPKNKAIVSAWDFAGDADVRISGDGLTAYGVVTDSRLVTAGCAFFAIKGESFDGNDFVQHAVDAGAAVVVTERDVRSDKADIVVVKDALAALDEG